jgi:hypothetical protein
MKQPDTSRVFSLAAAGEIAESSKGEGAVTRLLPPSPSKTQALPPLRWGEKYEAP